MIDTQFLLTISRENLKRFDLCRISESVIADTDQGKIEFCLTKFDQDLWDDFLTGKGRSIIFYGKVLVAPSYFNVEFKGEAYFLDYEEVETRAHSCQIEVIHCGYYATIQGKSIIDFDNCNNDDVYAYLNNCMKNGRIR